MTDTKQSTAFPEFEEPGGGGDDFGDVRAERQLASYFDRKRKGTGLGKRADDQLVSLLLKLSSPVDYVKLAEMDMRKRAEILKRIQSTFHRALPSLADKEPELDKETLDQMAKRPEESLAQMGSLGMVMKPREFQRMSLCSMGKPDLADMLEEKGSCFHARGGSGRELFPFGPQADGSMLDQLRPLIEGRSGLYPPLRRRSIRIVIAARPKSPVESPMVDHPCMDQLAEGYSGYRKRLLQLLPRLVQFLFRDHPSMVEPVCGSGELDRHLSPVADRKRDVLQSVLGMFPSMYFNRVHLPEPVSKALDARPNTHGLKRESL